MSYQKDRDEFVGVIVAEVASQNRGAIPQWARQQNAAALARLILRNAATIQRIAVKACNEGQSDKLDSQCEVAKNHIAAACAPWGIKPNFNGDPRGAYVKLILPSGRWNSFGGAEDGYCVPTR